MKKTNVKHSLATGLLSLMALNAANTHAAEALWTDVAQKTELNAVENLNVLASKHRLVSANMANLERQLYDRTINQYEMMLPLPNGTSALFRLTYAPVYQSGLAQKYPSIRTFTGYQVDKPANAGRFDITPQGFHGMFTVDGQRVYIDPLQRGNNATYISYYKKDANPLSQPLTDQVIQSVDSFAGQGDSKAASAQKLGETKKTYRIAVAASGEYTAFHGGTKELGQAAIVTMMNRVNEVYEVDLSVTLVLVDNNDTVVYTDASTDPFDNTSNDIDANITVMSNNIGNDNFDIGHVVNTAGGGLAGLGVVCGSSKAAGVTGSPAPTNDPFVIDFVAHEIGHQFGGNHPYNGQTGSCTTAGDSHAYEPGSGSTIMAYAGICGEQDLQDHSDAYFHVHSLDEMRSFIDTATCSVNTNLNNETPVANAGNDYTIPGSSPFKLTGSATDADGDDLTYGWEEFDLGTRSSSRAEMVDDGSRPLFRSWTPTSSPVRHLPRLSDIIGKTSVIGETYATTDRTLNFRLTVRDGQGNIHNDAMVVTVDKDTGPLVVTAPVAGDNWASGTSPVVSWDVANTDQAPVSCANVDILLSTDGGVTFDTTVTSGTANDGSEAVILPQLDATTSTARVQVVCSDNIFFAVSDGDFTVNATPSSETAPVIVSQSTIEVNEDDSVKVEFTDLTVTDTDDTYPTGFTMTLSDGNNYSVSGQVITPDTDYSGSLTVPVQLNDGTEDSGVFNLKVTVIGSNDVPVITEAPSFGVAEDNSLTPTVGHLAITDPDDTDADMTLLLSEGDNYSFSGTTITPDANFNGTLMIDMKVNDGEADSNTVTATVHVTPVNDRPMILGLVETLTIEQGSSLPVTLQMLDIFDPDNSIEDMSLLVFSGNNFSVDGTIVTPDVGYSGEISILVRVSDDSQNSSIVALPATVVAVDHPPVITGSTAQTINEDETLTLDKSMFTITDGDNTTDELIIMIVEGENYLFEGFTVHPTAEFSGELTVNVTVTDGEFTSEVHQMMVTVAAVNDVPVAGNDSFTVDEGSSGNSFGVLANDSDIEGDILTIDSITYTGTGTASISGSNIVYTPGNGFDGSESLSYTVSDGNGGTATGQVSITVTNKSSGGGGSMPFGLLAALLPLALVRRLKNKRAL